MPKIKPTTPQRKTKPPPPKRLCQTTLEGHKLPPKPPLPTKHHPSNYTNAVHQLTLTDTQGKHLDARGLIFPTGPALNHPAADLLLEIGKNGCPVDCGPHWTHTQIQAAIDYAAHPSAKTPLAAKTLRDKTLEKVKQGYARIVHWDDIKDDPPPNLKVSPIAAIPHKTRQFRAILDLSFVLRDL